MKFRDRFNVSVSRRMTASVAPYIAGQRCSSRYDLRWRRGRGRQLALVGELSAAAEAGRSSIIYMRIRIMVRPKEQIVQQGLSDWPRINVYTYVDGVVNYLTKTSLSFPSAWCCGYRRRTPSAWHRAAGFLGPGTWTSPCTAGSADRVLLKSCCGWFPDRLVTWVSAWHTYLHTNSRPIVNSLIIIIAITTIIICRRAPRKK